MHTDEAKSFYLHEIRGDRIGHKIWAHKSKKEYGRWLRLAVNL